MQMVPTRLPGVVVRPPLPNGALSGFNSDLIREPLAGEACNVRSKLKVWLQPPQLPSLSLLCTRQK